MIKFIFTFLSLVALTGWAHINTTKEHLSELFLKDKTQITLSKHYEYFMPSKDLDEIGNPYPCALIGENISVEKCYESKAYSQIKKQDYFSIESIEHECKEEIQEIEAYAQEYNCPDGYTEFHKIKYHIWLDYLYPNKKKEKFHEKN